MGQARSNKDQAGLLRHWPVVLIGLLAILVLAQAVRLVWALAEPTGPLGNWRAASAQSLTPQDQSTLIASIDPFFRSPQTSAASGTVTALDVRLFGINMNEASGGGSAIIAGADGVQSSFAVGDEVMPGVKLAGIAFDHVLLDRGGVRESLFIDQSVPATGAVPTPAPAPSPTPAPAPAASNGELSTQSLQAGVAMAARSEGGKITGLTVQPQGDGAAFRAAGLRPGDVIRSVNGRPIGSAAELAGQITPGARLSLEVERGSGVVPIAIFIGKQ